MPRASYPLDPQLDPGALLRRLRRVVYQQHQPEDPLLWPIAWPWPENDWTWADRAKDRLHRMRERRRLAADPHWGAYQIGCPSPAAVHVLKTEPHPEGGEWGDGCVGTIEVSYNDRGHRALYGVTPYGDLYLYAN